MNKEESSNIHKSKINKQLLERIQQLEEQNAYLWNELTKIQNSYTYRFISIIRNNFLDKVIKPHIRQKFYTSISLFVHHTSKLPIKFVIPRYSTNKPLISVIIPCYNYGQYLQEAIESVLNQTFQDFEIIIVNDGSTDPATIKLLKNINCPKTRVINQKNSKVPTARNNGIREARGKYICCLDADDKLTSTYLEKCLFIMELYKLDICSTWLQEFGDSKNIWHTSDLNISTIRDNNQLTTSSVFTKNIWKKTGGYNIKLNDGYEDWGFWIAIAEKGGRGMTIKEPLFLYRKHGYSLTNSAISKHKYLVKIIKTIFPRVYKDEKYVHKIYKKSQISYKAINPYTNLMAHRKVQSQEGVLFFTPWMVAGGADKRFLAMGKALLNNGEKVSFITTEEQPQYYDSWTNEYQKLTNDIFNLPALLKKEDYYTFVKYIIKSRNVKIIIIGGSNYAYQVTKKIKKDFPQIKIIDLLFNTEGHFESSLKFAEYIDTTIAENKTISKAYTRKNPSGYKKIKVIPNGVDISQYHMLKKSYKKKKIVISYIGRISPEKGPDIFINAIEKIHKKYPNCKFALAGNGPSLDECKRQINLLGLSNICKIPGNINTYEYLKKTDILIVPSRIDGRPNIILEAMASGVPVIASKTGGIPLLLGTNQERGLLFKPGSVNSLVKKISFLINNTQIRESLANKARVYTEKKLNDRVFLDEFVKTIKDSNL